MSVTLIHSKKYDLQKRKLLHNINWNRFLDMLKLAKNPLPFLWGRTWFSILANKQNLWITIVIWK